MTVFRPESILAIGSCLHLFQTQFMCCIDYRRWKLQFRFIWTSACRIELSHIIFVRYKLKIFGLDRPIIPESTFRWSKKLSKDDWRPMLFFRGFSQFIPFDKTVSSEFCLYLTQNIFLIPFSVHHIFFILGIWLHRTKLKNYFVLSCKEKRIFNARQFSGKKTYTFSDCLLKMLR